MNLHKSVKLEEYVLDDIETTTTLPLTNLDNFDKYLNEETNYQNNKDFDVELTAPLYLDDIGKPDHNFNQRRDNVVKKQSNYNGLFSNVTPKKIRQSISDLVKYRGQDSKFIIFFTFILFFSWQD